MNYTAKSKAQRSYNLKTGIIFGTDSKDEIDACGKRKEDTDFLPTLQAGYIKKQRWEGRGRMRDGVCARRLAEWNGPEHGAWCLMVWLSDWKRSWRGMRKRCASCFLEFLRSVILMHPLQNPSFYFANILVYILLGTHFANHVGIKSRRESFHLPACICEFPC